MSNLDKFTAYVLLPLGILLLIGLMYSCVTPDHWSPESHREIMSSCRSMCGEGNVRDYDPSTGECRCMNHVGDENEQ